MKKLILIFPALFIMGCSVQKEVGCCEADEHQCDELYPYYNCPDPVPVYHYRDYKRTWSNSYTSGYDSYYPNTQTVYYVPVQECVEPPVNNGTIISNTPRPSSLGEYRERDKTDVYGNRLQPNQYPTRDINGQRGVGDVTRPNAPKITKD